MRSETSDRSAPADAPKGGNSPLLCTGQSYLERLGVLYMERIRITIVTELFTREMSPAQFYESFGGSSYWSVYRHFKKLVNHGWLRPVRSVSPGPGRPGGRPGMLHRATELPVIDTETWERFPTSIRDAFTVQALEEMGCRLGEALRAGTAVQLREPIAQFHASQLDEPGWCKALGAVERCFRVLSQVQTDAKIRIELGQEKPLSMIVNLGAFELPAGQSTRPLQGSDPPSADRSLMGRDWPRRMGKVFADPVALAIIDVLNRADATPNELHQTLGDVASPRQILEKCQQMTELGWLVQLDDGRPGGTHRGARIVRFRAATPTASEAAIYRSIPKSLRKGESWQVFDRFSTASLAALRNGTFNSRPDRHLTLNQLLVDERGWAQVIEAVHECAEFLAKVDQDTQRRREAVGRVSSIGLLVSAFEAPPRGSRV
jgi:hypothetical protein